MFYKQRMAAAYTNALKALPVDPNHLAYFRLRQFQADQAVPHFKRDGFSAPEAGALLVSMMVQVGAQEGGIDTLRATLYVGELAKWAHSRGCSAEVVRLILKQIMPEEASPTDG